MQGRLFKNVLSRSIIFVVFDEFGAPVTSDRFQKTMLNQVHIRHLRPRVLPIQRLVIDSRTVVDLRCFVPVRPALRRVRLREQWNVPHRLKLL